MDRDVILPSGVAYWSEITWWVLGDAPGDVKTLVVEAPGQERFAFTFQPGAGEEHTTIEIRHRQWLNRPFGDEIIKLREQDDTWTVESVSARTYQWEGDDRITDGRDNLADDDIDQLIQRSTAYVDLLQKRVQDRTLYRTTNY